MIHGIDTSLLVAAELVAHSKHEPSRAMVQQMAQSGENMAVAPQVLAEFVHAVTDSRRCKVPLTVPTALQRADEIWNAATVVQVFPDATAVSQFFDWMRQHRLGRKRLLDTLLAATYWSAGVRSIATLNRADFDLFRSFTIVEP
jgi:predicted nucleic acid-binding protein